MAQVEPSSVPATVGHSPSSLPVSDQLSNVVATLPTAEATQAGTSSKQQIYESPNTETGAKFPVGDDDDVQFVFAVPRRKKKKRKRMEDFYPPNGFSEVPRYFPFAGLPPPLEDTAPSDSLRRGTTGVVHRLESCHTEDDETKRGRGTSLPASTSNSQPTRNSAASPPWSSIQTVEIAGKKHKNSGNLEELRPRPPSLDTQVSPRTKPAPKPAHTFGSFPQNNMRESTPSLSSFDTRQSITGSTNFDWNAFEVFCQDLIAPQGLPTPSAPTTMSQQFVQKRSSTPPENTMTQPPSNHKVQVPIPNQTYLASLREVPLSIPQGRNQYKSPYVPFEALAEQQANRVRQQAAAISVNPIPPRPPSTTSRAISPFVRAPQTSASGQPNFRGTDSADILRRPSLYKVPPWVSSPQCAHSAQTPRTITLPNVQAQNFASPAPRPVQVPSNPATQRQIHPSPRPELVNGQSSRTQALRKHSPNLIVDIAETCQELFPFAAVAERHQVPIQKVFDTFSGIIQLPLLRNADDKRRHGLLGKQRVKEFRDAKKAMEKAQAAEMREKRKEKAKTPLLKTAILNNVRDKESHGGGGGV